MAKGQRRSNREIRKPKQDKKPAKTESAFGSQVKNTDSGFTTSKKTKR